jgi:citrate lyase subunit beta / citryl-CoA lyase
MTTVSTPPAPRKRRVELAVPGSNEEMMAKAAASSADFVFLDLEDAVAPRAKTEARAKVIKALNTLDWQGKVRCVRINDLLTPWAHDDIIEVVTQAGNNLDVLMIPKVMSDKDVYFVDILLTQLEKKLGMTKRIGIEVLIEETQALINVESIAKSSPRLEAMILGIGDYSASQGIDLRMAGIEVGYPGDLWHYARFRMAMAARAAGIVAIDGPYPKLRDEAGFREECRRASILGMVGKWALHPSQIPTALEMFTPKPKDVKMARTIIAAYAKAEAAGLGAVEFNGIFIDAATVRLVRNIADRADLLGV